MVLMLFSVYFPTFSSLYIHFQICTFNLVPLLQFSLALFYIIFNFVVFLGNHECRTVSGHFGFKEECKIKYGVNVYYRFLLTFQTMPLAAVISTAYGDIFACHGGLSPQWQTLGKVMCVCVCVYLREYMCRYVCMDTYMYVYVCRSIIAIRIVINTIIIIIVSLSNS